MLSIFKRKTLGNPEAAENWKVARLKGSEILGVMYVASLTLLSDTSKQVHGIVRTQDTRTYMDIPLVDPTSQESLANRAYLNTTFFGTPDRNKLEKFGSEFYNVEALMAHLNKSAAEKDGHNPQEAGAISSWFYSTFQVEHLKKYGSLYIGSSGGNGPNGYRFNATLEESRRGRTKFLESVPAAQEFSRKARLSLRHLALAPVPVSSYLERLQTSLRFLPQDWN